MNDCLTTPEFRFYKRQRDRRGVAGRACAPPSALVRRRNRPTAHVGGGRTAVELGDDDSIGIAALWSLPMPTTSCCSHEHEGLRQAYADADLVLVDGMPVLLAAKLLRRGIPERVAGSDLVPALFAAGSRRASDESEPFARELRVYLLGGALGVAERAAANIGRRWSGVRIVGCDSPPLGFERRPEENDAILSRVASAEPDVLIVGLGRAEAGAVGSCPSRSNRSAGRAVRRRNDRFPGRRAGSSAAVDAADRPGMAASHGQRAAATGQALSARRHPISGTCLARAGWTSLKPCNLGVSATDPKLTYVNFGL